MKVCCPKKICGKGDECFQDRIILQSLLVNQINRPGKGRGKWNQGYFRIAIVFGCLTGTETDADILVHQGQAGIDLVADIGYFVRKTGGGHSG